MSKDLLVFSAASKRSRLLDLLERQLADAGIDFYIRIFPRHVTWASISTPQTLLDNLELVLSLGYEKVATVDAFDMLFFGSREELADKIAGNLVLFCADRNLVPPEMGEENFPVTGTPWRFVNGGGWAGTREALRAFRETFVAATSAEGETGNTVLNRLLASRLEPGFRIDSEGVLFHNFYLDQGELVRMGDRPWNTLTGEQPSFVHFAGGIDPRPFLADYAPDFTIPRERWIRGEFPHYR